MSRDARIAMLMVIEQTTKRATELLMFSEFNPDPAGNLEPLTMSTYAKGLFYLPFIYVLTFCF
jgi:hypothetical protein